MLESIKANRFFRKKPNDISKYAQKTGVKNGKSGKKIWIRGKTLTKRGVEHKINRYP